MTVLDEKQSINLIDILNVGIHYRHTQIATQYCNNAKPNR